MSDTLPFPVECRKCSSTRLSEVREGRGLGKDLHNYGRLYRIVRGYHLYLAYNLTCHASATTAKIGSLARPQPLWRPFPKMSKLPTLSDTHVRTLRQRLPSCTLASLKVAVAPNLERNGGATSYVHANTVVIVARLPEAAIFLLTVPPLPHQSLCHCRPPLLYPQAQSLLRLKHPKRLT